MNRGNQSTIILFIMGAAIVLAAVLALAVSSIRNRPDEVPTGEVVTIKNQPITLRRNPNLTVQLAPPEGVIIVDPAPAPVVVQNDTPGATETATPPPQPSETPASPQNGAATPTATLVPVQVTVKSIITEAYVVQAGDTLYRLTTLKVTSIALMAEYGISQKSLNPGETISIPIGNPAFCPGRRPYAVGEGETVFSISQKVKVTAVELQSINQLGPDFGINAGQILCVP